MRDLIKWLAFIAIAALLLFAVLSQAAAQQPAGKFDHQVCQYPTRTTNPPNACDNSDPCDPAGAAKGGSGECAAVMPSGTETPMSQNIEIAEFGGK